MKSVDWELYGDGRLTYSGITVNVVFKQWVKEAYLQVPQPFLECFPEVRLLFNDAGASCSEGPLGMTDSLYQSNVQEL
jgi:hypothetical protein